MASKTNLTTAFDGKGRIRIIRRDSKGRFMKHDLEALEREMQEEYIQGLAALGAAAIQYAYEQGNTSAPKEYERGEDGERHPIPDEKWRNKTFNLHDSFGSAVFVAGRLRHDTVSYVGPEEAKRGERRLKKTGRDVLDEYFRRATYGAEKHEIVLVCLAAMYYTRYLEEGTHRGGYKIRVISYATDFIRENWKYYVGKKGKHVVLKGLYFNYEKYKRDRDGEFGDDYE